MIEGLADKIATHRDSLREPLLDRGSARVADDGRSAELLSQLGAARAERHQAEYAHLKQEFRPAALRDGWTAEAVDAHVMSGALRLFGIDPWRVGPSFFPLVPDRVVAPPYDTDWQTGTSLAAFARHDGKFFVMASSNGFNAGGIGFHLSIKARREAGITPIGSYTWNSFCVTDQPAIRSRGGLAITVFRDGGDVPVIDRDITLWNTVGMAAFQGIQGGGPLATAASLPTGFGPIRLAPAWFTMDPGSDYLVWIWGWHSGAVPEDVGFWAAMNVTVSAVNVDFEDPFVGPA